jgi:hypothetical protein
MLRHCLAAIYFWINVATELLARILPFFYDPSKYVPQIALLNTDETATDLMSPPLTTLPVPPPLPTSSVPSGYFVAPLEPAMISTFEPLFGELCK